METDLKIFECGKCDKTFGVGVNFIHLEYYNKQGLTEDQAFEEYYKELKNAGATAIHLKERPKECPYCKSKDIYQLNLASSFKHSKIYVDNDLKIHECKECHKLFGSGVGKVHLEYYRKYEGLRDDEAYEKYHKKLIDAGATAVLLEERPKECPYCKSKEIHDVSAETKFERLRSNISIQAVPSETIEICSICEKAFVFGMNKQHVFNMVALGVTSIDKIFDLYKEERVLLDKFHPREANSIWYELSYFLLKQTKCPHCNAEVKDHKKDV